MATGDAALAAGMAIMSGSEPANTLDTEVNLTRDYIAQRTSSVTPVSKGGTGSTTAEAARAALGAAATTHNHDDRYFTESETYNRTVIDAAFSDRDADITYVQQGNMTADVYNRVLSGSYRVAYVNSSGVLGWVSSSRRYKEDIVTAGINVDAVLAMDVVTYHRIGSGEGQIEHGLIAEDLHDLGLTWLVDYGQGNQPEGVRYDILALALIPTIRSLNDRLTTIETHLDALRGDLDAGREDMA